MKEIIELNFPKDLKYSSDHEWVRVVNGNVRVGIDDYAQDQMGDIVYVELPKVGDVLTQGASFGVVESVKSVSDMLMPLSGEIVAVNKSLENNPGSVNKSPYEEGWMLIVKPSDLEEIKDLMDNVSYVEFLKGL